MSFVVENLVRALAFPLSFVSYKRVVVCGYFVYHFVNKGDIATMFVFLFFLSCLFVSVWIKFKTPLCE